MKMVLLAGVLGRDGVGAIKVVDMLVPHILAAVTGGLVGLAVLALRVLPHKVSRDTVEKMLREQPLQFQFQELKRRVDQTHETLEGIRTEIVGLRGDVVRLTTTLELMLARRM
jgi:hypothetical protein